MGESKLVVLSVLSKRSTHEDGIEPLEEGHTVDEVQALSSGSTDAVDDEVNTVGITTDRTVERPL